MNEYLRMVIQFSKDRDWIKHHDPRSLILALTAELGELAELFQWTKHSATRLSPSRRIAIESEVADMFIYLFCLCASLDIDPDQAVREKLALNADRFPLGK